MSRAVKCRKKAFLFAEKKMLSLQFFSIKHCRALESGSFAGFPGDLEVAA